MISKDLNNPKFVSNMKSGIGLLSWHGYESLKHVLSCYQDVSLFSHFDHRCIFLPEQREKETELARQYGLDIYGSEKNLGILGGFQRLAECVDSDIMLLLENDCPTDESPEKVKQQINQAFDLIKSGRADIVYMRNRARPGYCFDAPGKFKRLYPPPHSSQTEKIKGFLRRSFRPGKARRMAGWSAYTDDAHHHPACRQYVSYDEDLDCYFTNSAHISWTNQSVMLKKSFFMEKILSYAVSAKTRRRVNGFKNLEIEMNAPYWRTLNAKIAIPQGLFTHARIGARGYA